MNPYQVLGVPQDADKHTIRKAYKVLAQRNHPDKGGDAESFQRIQAAYDILKDDAERAYFDETGETRPKPKPVEEEAKASLRQVFMDMADANQWKPGRYVAEMRRVLDQETSETKGKVHGIEKVLKRIEKSLPEHDDGVDADDIFAVTMRAKVSKLQGELTNEQHKLEVLEKCSEILAPYKDTYEEPQQMMIKTFLANHPGAFTSGSTT